MEKKLTSGLQRPIVQRLLAFLAGAVGVTAFSPFDFWPAGLISLFGLLYFSNRQSPKNAAKIGFCWGFGLFIFGVSWVYVSIQHFGGVAPVVAGGLVILLSAYLALFPALFSYLLTRFWRANSLSSLTIVAPIIWCATEWIRGWLFGGFPWLQFGYSQINGPLKGLAPIWGVNSMTLLLLSISGLLVFSLQNKHKLSAVMAVILLVAPISLKYMRWVTPDATRSADVALIQGNTDQAIKWSASHLEHIITTYTQMTEPYLGKKAIVIWPEAAIPSLENHQQVFLSELDQIATEKQTQIALGVVNYDAPERAYYNALIVLGDKTPYEYPTTNRYNKHYLVPFGETVPFKFLFDVIAKVLAIPMSNMTPGNYIQAPLTISDFHFVSAICYEIIRGQQLRDNFTDDTDFILTVSNDTWFGHSIGPWQHFQMARMRALELGRPVIRGTNNGITAIIDSQGNVTEQLPQFTQAVLDTQVTPTKGQTPYTTWGFTMYQWMLGLLSVAAVFFAFKRQR